MTNTLKTRVIELNSQLSLVESEWDISPRQAGEITIKVISAGLNPVDYKFCNGSIPIELPAVLGHECLGEIIDSDHHDDIGRRVLAYLPGPHTQSSGTWCDTLHVPSLFTTLIPDTAPVEYAAYPLCGLTAMRCFRRIKHQGIKHCFVAGVSGGVGWLFTQLCIHHGITVYTTVRSEASRDKIQSSFNDSVHCMIATNATSSDAIQQHFKRNYFDACADFVGGQQKLLALSLCGFNGHFITIVEEQSGSIDLLNARESPAFQKSLCVHFEFLGAQAYFGTPTHQKTYQNELQQLIPLLDKRTLHYPNIKILEGLHAETVQTGLDQLEERTNPNVNKIIVTNTNETCA